MKVRFERSTRWLGNGFGSETLHRAYRGDELVGEWSTKMPVPWAGQVRGAQVHALRRLATHRKGGGMKCAECGEPLMWTHDDSADRYVGHEAKPVEAEHHNRSALAELAIEFGDYRRAGYKVERWDRDGWLLTLDGEQLQVGGYGGISPTKYAAELEAYRRIAQDERLANGG